MRPMLVLLSLLGVLFAVPAASAEHTTLACADVLTDTSLGTGVCLAVSDDAQTFCTTFFYEIVDVDRYAIGCLGENPTCPVWTEASPVSAGQCHSHPVLLLVGDTAFAAYTFVDPFIPPNEGT